MLGALFGLLFGLFVAVDLLLAGAFPLHAPAVVLLPLAGLLIGLALGWWAPLRRRKRDLTPAADVTVFAQRQASELTTLADDEASA